MLRILEADITTLAMDAIVNAANETLLGGGGVDGAIHRRAGPGLLEACRKIGGCATGQSCITSGFDLPSRWVIHTVGPRWRDGQSGEAELLESCYVNSLELAMDHQISSIAFPGISTGIYGYPKPEAAKIAFSTMRIYEKNFDEIVICCFSAEDREIYEKELRKD